MRKHLRRFDFRHNHVEGVRQYVLWSLFVLTNFTDGVATLCRRGVITVRERHFLECAFQSGVCTGRLKFFQRSFSFRMSQEATQTMQHTLTLITKTLNCISKHPKMLGFFFRKLKSKTHNCSTPTIIRQMLVQSDHRCVKHRGQSSVRPRNRT